MWVCETQDWKKFIYLFWAHAFFISNTFISSARLKLASNQAKLSSTLRLNFLQEENKMCKEKKKKKKTIVSVLMIKYENDHKK